MQLFHSTTSDLTPHKGLCLTDDADVADGYLDGQAGHRYTITIPDPHQLEWADEDDLAEAAEACGMTEDDWMDWGGIFYAADQPEVRAHLAAEGYQAVQYTDQEQGSGDAHRTWRVLDPAIAAIASRESVTGRA